MFTSWDCELIGRLRACLIREQRDKAVQTGRAWAQVRDEEGDSVSVKTTAVGFTFSQK